MTAGAKEGRTVSLTGRDVDDAARLLRRVIASEGGSPTQASDDPRIPAIKAAKAQLKNRRLRARVFGKAMFHEPAWEMLLTLYTDKNVDRLTVTNLASHSGAPPTTALRWIDYLEKRALVRRRPHANDARVAMIELTDEGANALDAYFAETLAERE